VFVWWWYTKGSSGIFIKQSWSPYPARPFRTSYKSTFNCPHQNSMSASPMSPRNSIKVTLGLFGEGILISVSAVNKKPGVATGLRWNHRNCFSGVHRKHRFSNVRQNADFLLLTDIPVFGWTTEKRCFGALSVLVYDCFGTYPIFLRNTGETDEITTAKSANPDKDKIGRIFQTRG